MKKVLKFAPLCAFVLTLVAFILLMATHSVVNNDNSGTWFSGISAIFGGGTGAVLGYEGDADATLAWNALLGWIFILVALVALCVSSVMVFVKIKALEKFGGLIALVSAGLLLVGGILLFFTVPAFGAANDWSSTDGWSLGAGWIVSAILAIVGGVVSACPAVLALIKK